jgi:leucine zipper transcription factor-like protein 1
MTSKQLADFITFYSVKRDLFAAEVSSTFNDFGEERVTEDIYSRDDVLSMLQDLQQIATARVKRDHDTAAGMSGILLEQVLMAAEAAGCGTISIDLSRTEDANSIERMKNINTIMHAPSSARLGAPRLDANAGRLESLREEQSRLREEHEQVVNELKSMRERNVMLQQQTAALLKEKSDRTQREKSLEDEIERLKKAEAASGASKASSNAALQQQLQSQVADLTQRLEQATNDARSAAREKDQKLTESKQFVQMRTLMARKNAQIVELRGRLSKYENVGGSEGSDVKDED